ncbi:hypothetical protein KQI84_14395 [bacterium]|nr:hypothetical protein [bacterium]
MRGLAQILYGTFCLDTHEKIAHGLHIGVAIPYTVWRSIGISPYDLDAIGLLRPGWEHYVQGNLEADVQGQCRRFKLDNTFLINYLRLCLEHMDENSCVNVIDGESYKTRRFERSPKVKRRSGRPMRTGRAKVNWAAGLARAYDLLRIAEALTSPRHRARAIQAIRCLQGIRSQPSFRFSRNEPGMASYIPVYHRVECGGRWYEKDSGFQGLPECIKAALLIGTDQINSDLKSCHIAAAVALAGEINAHAGYQEHYHLMVKGLQATDAEKERGLFGVRDLLKLKSAYDRIAQAAELPRKVVKRCILATLYGANTGPGLWRSKDGKRSSGAIMATLLDHHQDNYWAARKSYHRLMPLMIHIVEFAGTLEDTISTVMDEPAWWRRSRGKLRQMVQVGYGSLINAVGSRIEITLPSTSKEEDRRAMSRRALSHILTGIEQHAIGHLLDVLKGEGVTVLHLEHDGLVTDRVIPQVCIKYMINKSLMPDYMHLEAKPFDLETEDDVENLAKQIRPRGQSTSRGTRPQGVQGPRTPAPLRCGENDDSSVLSADFTGLTTKGRASRNGKLLYGERGNQAR